MFLKVWRVTQGPREKQNAPYRLTISRLTQLLRTWTIVVQQVSTLCWFFFLIPLFTRAQLHLHKYSI